MTTVRWVVAALIAIVGGVLSLAAGPSRCEVTTTSEFVPQEELEVVRVVETCGPHGVDSPSVIAGAVVIALLLAPDLKSASAFGISVTRLLRKEAAETKKLVKEEAEATRAQFVTYIEERSNLRVGDGAVINISGDLTQEVQNTDDLAAVLGDPNIADGAIGAVRSGDLDPDAPNDDVEVEGLDADDEEGDRPRKPRHLR